MTRLYDLRKRLARLRRRRRRVRWGTGYAALAVGVLCILAAAFLFDWLFERNMGVPERVGLLAACAVAAVWAFRRFTQPWLGRRETDLDMALLVERQEHIDSDLIAAIEFESPEAPEWGSVKLEQAVIDGVVTTSPRLNVMRGLSRRQLGRNAGALLLTLVAWAIIGGTAPRHTLAFLERVFLLSAVHYPTDTQIVALTINGRDVDLARPGKTPVHVLHGEPVRFEVTCGGTLPEDGRAQLTAVRSGLRKSLVLERSGKTSTLYTAELDQLREVVRYELELGDAWTDPGTLAVTELPIVELQLEVVPPEYAQKDSKAIRMPPGLRQVSVIEGSQVRVRIRSDKPLRSAAFSIDQDDGQYEFTRSEADEADDPWQLWVVRPEGTPLETVLEPIRYEIQVTDQDEQHLEQPIKGVIRIQADAPPRVAAGIITRFVLPTAAPRVHFRALDDYGLARISILREVLRSDGQAAEDDVEVYRLPPGQPPQRDLESPKDGYRLDLTPLDLDKGDRVTITVQARDYRGRQEGKLSSAESLVLQVTDEEGILSSMLEADQMSARQLKNMIQRQLGIGESP